MIDKDSILAKKNPLNSNPNSIPQPLKLPKKHKNPRRKKSHFLKMKTEMKRNKKEESKATLRKRLFMCKKIKKMKRRSLLVRPNTSRRRQE
jgi:hypothetical protein